MLAMSITDVMNALMYSCSHCFVQVQIYEYSALGDDILMIYLNNTRATEEKAFIH